MKKIVLFLLLATNLSVFAQQDALFTQYMFNKLLVNPAYAGSRELTTIEIHDRYQWVGIDGAPKTVTLSMNTAINEKKIGLGLYYFRDEIAPIVSQGLMATYAYRIRLEKGWFSMGLQGGLKSLNYDWAIIRTKYPDYLFYPQEIQKYTPDFNLGLYYQSQNFFAGLSSKHLLENEIAVGEVDGKSTFSKLARHFYFMTGFALPINDKMAFRPSMLTKYTRNSPVQFDFNASIVFNNIFWVGMSYRTVSALTFMTEFTMLKNLRLGYSFDLYVNDLQLHNKGSHEIRLAYDFARNSRMKTPRYF